VFSDQVLRGGGRFSDLVFSGGPFSDSVLGYFFLIRWTFF
jgi:hypothetical protein